MVGLILPLPARTRRHRHGAVEPRFYGLPNLFNILRNASFLAIMACGQMLVMIAVAWISRSAPRPHSRALLQRR